MKPRRKREYRPKREAHPRSPRTGWCCVCGGGITANEPVAYLRAKDRPLRPAPVHPGDCFDEAVRRGGIPM